MGGDGMLDCAAARSRFDARLGERCLALSFGALLLGLACSSNAQTLSPERPARANELMQGLASTIDYQETSIAPDHRYVAWVRAQPVTGSSTVGSAVFFRSTEHGGTVLPVTAKLAADAAGSAAAKEKDIAWAPDSSSLAFLSDAKSPGQLQLYVMSVKDRSVRQLTQLKGYLATPHWSPSGRQIAFLFTENAVREAGPLAAAAPAEGVIDEQVYEQRIAIVDLTSGEVRQVSPADLYVYEYDWSPDGGQLVATAAHGVGDNNWYVAEIYTFDLATGAARSLLRPAMQIAVPRWSPDGRWIAFVGGLMSDEGIASGDVYLLPATGGEVRNLTPALQGSAYWLAWRANSRDILLAEAVEGGSGLAELNSKTGALKTRWQGGQTVRAPEGFAFGISLASDGETSALIRESFNEPPAVWVGRIGAWAMLIPPSTSGKTAWGQAESVHWQSDGFSVQGWLVPPASLDPGRKYPLVVVPHGGPSWLTAPLWPTPFEDSRIALLASRDYFVFFPNFRGSAGFGERFKKANVKDFGGGDLRDILAGIRHVVATHPVDDKRVGITGWSYGGYMSMWAITQTPRFRAAVVGAGLSDWLSYYGENGIDEWMIPFFGASVYDDPAVYAKSSPINFIKQVRTPTLLVVGDSDVECPPPQSFEYWHALNTFNVKTQLVVYPHEGHRFSELSHAQDVMQRMLAWFDDNMPPDPKP
jgi:dipeptidyl aminopeptidase/acylaminoacyl peptidase